MNKSFGLTKSDTFYRNYLLLAFAAFSRDTILRYAEIFIRKLPVVSRFADMFIPCLFIFLILLNINKSPVLVRHIKSIDGFFILSYILFVILNLGLFPENRSYIFKYAETVFIIVPAYYLLGITFFLDNKTMLWLSRLAKLIILIDILFVIYWQSKGNVLGEDSMTRAYNLLPNVLILIYMSFERSKMQDILFAVFGGVYLMTMGTRGPVVIELIFLLYCLIIKKKKTFFRTVLSIGSVVAMVGFFYSSLFNKTLLYLTDIFSKLGLSTRTITHLLNESFVNDSSGRDTIYDYVWELIEKKWFFGYGIFGEYPFLNWNTHNFYLQIFMHFGLVFGVVFLAVLLILIARSYCKSKNQVAKDYLILWACVTLVHGFFGGSYLSYYCAFMIGIAVREIRNTRQYSLK